MSLWNSYFTPTSVDEALELLAEHKGEARIIAGGTDIILEMERGQRPDVGALIDITRIPGLDRIELSDKGEIHLGPLVTHNHCAASKVIQERAFGLARACWEVGAPQIRNRATVAGNLITASPANDSITPLLALGASVTLKSKKSERTLPLTAFYPRFRETVMRDDEILTDIRFQALPADGRSIFFKLGLRQAQAISIIDLAIVLNFADGRIREASIALGSVAPTVILAEKAATHLLGQVLDEEVILQVARLTAEEAVPIDDVRGSARYRRAMVENGTRRALRALANNAEREAYPQDPVTLWGDGEYHWTETLSNPSEHHGEQKIETTINGKRHVVETGYDKTLLRFLREDLGLTGTKEGCAEGECGACTVLMDGMAVMACMVPAPRAHLADIKTVEGLAKNGQLHPIQQAFIEEGAVQCGYCTPGFLMSGAQLLAERPDPDLNEIQQSITGNLCRCTGYYSIVKAFQRAVALQEATSGNDGGAA